MGSPIKVLIVEDEMLIGAKISLFLTQLDYSVIGMIPRAEDALLLVEESKPDIALLDINLKGSLDGIALGKVLQLEYNIPVVFLTANSDDLTFQRAKEAKPYAFLAKPFNRKDLQRALELTVSLMGHRSKSLSNNIEKEIDPPLILSDRIFVYYNDKKIKILFSTILHIEAERNYCRIVTIEKYYLLTMPMKSLEAALPADLFQRIHRSYIVNITHVNEIGESVIKVGNKNLPISKSYKKDFLLRIRSV